MRWHYTTGEFFPAIIESKMIKLSTDSVGPERPAAWFSSNQHYDESARGKILTTSDAISGRTESLRIPMAVIAEKGGVFGIGVEENNAPVPWERYKTESGLPAADAEVMEAGPGKPNEWFASYNPVPMSCWRVVEAYEVAGRLNQWVPALESSVGKLMVQAGLLANLRALVAVWEIGDGIAGLTAIQAAELSEYLRVTYGIK